MPKRERETPYLSVEEVREQYSGKWVVMRIREHDENHLPKAGEVLYAGRHSRAWDHFSRVPREVLDEAKETYTPFYIFKAQPLITSGPEYDKVVRRFISDLTRLRSLGINVTITDPEKS